MFCLFAVLLVLSPSSVLSPEAVAHNTEAMRFYDAGQFSAAVDEFLAAYQAMPDVRTTIESACASCWRRRGGRRG